MGLILVEFDFSNPLAKIGSNGNHTKLCKSTKDVCPQREGVSIQRNVVDPHVEVCPIQNDEKGHCGLSCNGSCRSKDEAYSAENLRYTADDDPKFCTEWKRFRYNRCEPFDIDEGVPSSTSEVKSS